MYTMYMSPHQDLIYIFSLIFMGLESSFLNYFISSGNETIFISDTHVTLMINVLSMHSIHPMAPKLCI